MDREFEELRARSHRNLIAFLGAELDLGFTFVRTARLETDADNQKHFELARKNAESALESVHQFQAMIVDSGVRQGIGACGGT
jgi:hypothetical protein